MRALLVFILKAACVIAVIVFLADRPGQVSLDWLGWHIDSSVAVLLGGLLLLLLVLGALGRVWRGIGRGIGRLRNRRAAQRRADGGRALAQGLAAVAVADAGAATRYARRAGALAGDQPLTRLLTAEAAMTRGDSPTARREFTALAQDPDSAILGQRGLIALALQAGDQPAALAVADQALRAGNAPAWLLDLAAELQARQGRWGDAATTLERWRRNAADTPLQKLALRQATVLVALAASLRIKDPAAALRHARTAVGIQPDFVPAVALLAELEIARGRAGRALAAIEKAWPRAPHPDLAALYRAALGEQDVAGQLRKLARLSQLAPESAESYLPLAEVALAGRLWGEARRHLERALLLGPDGQARACHLMATVELAEHDNRAGALAWRERALTATSPTWRCTACATPSPTWQPRCPACDQTAGLAWRGGAAGAAPAPRTTLDWTDLTTDRDPAKLLLQSPAP